MEAEFIRYVVDKGVAVITIDRPQAANAQNPQLLRNSMRRGASRTAIPEVRVGGAA